MTIEHFPQAEQLMTRHDIAKLMRCSLSTVDRRRLNDPDFPRPVRFGPRQLRYRESDALRYIASLPFAEYDSPYRVVSIA